MTHSLNYHRDGYAYPKNYFQDKGGLLKGLKAPCPYASRHQDLSHDYATRRKGHERIKKIESIPYLGHIAGLIEKTVVSIMNHFSNPRKMKDNLKEALTGYKVDLKDSPEEADLIGTLKELPKATKKPIETIEVFVDENVGGRGNSKKYMEDVHYSKDSEDEWIGGIFDGHNGKACAQMASSYFESANFSDDPRSSFMHHFKEAQKHVLQDKEAGYAGSTAIVARLNKKTSELFLAGVGDCEAFYYLEVEGTMKCFPLLPKRNLSVKKEAERIANALGNQEIVNDNMNAKDPKKLRYPAEMGLNVSRSLGDGPIAGPVDHATISHKPKVSSVTLGKGYLVLACDGFTEHLPTQKEIIEVLAKHPEKPAQALMNQALTHKKKGSDNITLFVVKL